MVENVWVGVDVGRHAHHAAAVDAHGAILWSRRIRNDQAEIETVLERVADMESVVWAIDMTAPESALLRGVLTAHRQQVRYVPGRVVHSMTGAFAGEGKTDARDAVVIAQTARLRTDLALVAAPDDLAIELELLTGHRSDLVAERTRGINRLRGLLTRIFPGLERCFDYSTLTGLAFLTHFATPSAINAATDEDIYDLGFWNRCQASGPAAALSLSRSLAVISPRSAQPPNWPPTPDWPRSRTIRGTVTAPYADRSAITAGYGRCSTWPRSTALNATGPRESSTNANVARNARLCTR